jgi:hypothetical protein
MPYAIELGSNHRWVDSHFSGHTTLEDILAINLTLVRLLDESKAEKLDLLTDVTEVKSQPLQVSKIWSSSKQVLRHPKFGTWIIVGIHNPFLKFTLDILIRQAEIPYRKFDCREAALDFLLEQVSKKV